MPIYGAAKHRNMSRSLLPSRRRKGAREDLNAVRRANRHRVNQSLRCSTRCIDWDDELDDFTADDMHEIRNCVFDRREADNVAAVMQWAPKVSAHLRPEDRMSYVRALLPDNIIGWHAMTHIQYADGMLSEEEDRIRHPWRYQHDANKQTAADRLAIIAYAAIVTGQHKAFNKMVKPQYLVLNYKNVEYKKYRPLYGLHDIDAWVAGFPMFNNTLYKRVIDWAEKELPVMPNGEALLS